MIRKYESNVLIANVQKVNTLQKVKKQKVNTLRGQKLDHLAINSTTTVAGKLGLP